MRSKHGEEDDDAAAAVLAGAHSGGPEGRSRPEALCERTPALAGRAVQRQVGAKDGWFMDGLYDRTRRVRLRDRTDRVIGGGADLLSIAASERLATGGGATA